MPLDPLKHLLGLPEIGSHKKKVILGRLDFAGTKDELLKEHKIV